MTRFESPHPPGDAPVLVGSDRALIVVPTYNEHDNLEMFLLAVRRAAPAAHILVVDDGSPDGTGEIVDRFAEKDDHVHCLHRKGKMGLGRAYVDGFTWGLARDYQYFFEMDADLSHNPSYLPAFFEAFQNGADVVVGSRNIPGGSVEGWGVGRHFVSKGGSLYSRLILGVDVHDLTTGFKGYTRKALEAIDVTSLHSNGYSFQIETTYRALRNKMRVVETPIVFVDRQLGKSKMNSRIFAEAVMVVWRLRLGLLRRHVSRPRGSDARGSDARGLVRSLRVDGQDDPSARSRTQRPTSAQPVYVVSTRSSRIPGPTSSAASRARSNFVGWMSARENPSRRATHSSTVRSRTGNVERLP